MKLPERGTMVKYAVASGVAVLLGYGYLAGQQAQIGPFAQQSAADQMRLLCDAFTVPGMLLILSGLLMTVANQGALDGLGYLGHYMYHMFVPGKRDGTERYADYVEKKQGKRAKRAGGHGFLFVVGGVCMVIALVFFGLFYYFY